MTNPDPAILDIALTDSLAHALGAPTAFHMNMTPQEHIAFLASLVRRHHRRQDGWLTVDEVRTEDAIARDRAKSRALARALSDQAREEERYDFRRVG